MRVRFGARSKATVRVLPRGPGDTLPHRARVAGFTAAPGTAAVLVGHKRRRLLVALHEPEAAGALAIARLPADSHVALDARALSPTATASVIAGMVLRAWRFDRLRTRPDPLGGVALERLDVLTADPDAMQAAWNTLRPAIDGALFARDLVSEPGNILTPQGFAARLARLEREGVQVEILDRAQLATEGLGALLAVGGGSVHPPCLAVLRWPGAGTLNDRADPAVLVGKGITFDTGGISIKPGPGMWDMRADMAGAAACVGAMLALALRRSPVSAVAVLALAENATGATSYRPGDVLHTYDGTTVEVVDTDAEGRLVLADALAWSVRNLRPRALVDLATLTGAIVTTLGHDRAGLFGTDDGLRDALLAAGDAVQEPLWPMPIAPKNALLSDVADLLQCTAGPRQPDAQLAATFLRHFVQDVPWAHLDIAGVEQRERGPWYDPDRHALGATGFGVRLLDRWLASLV